MDSLSPRKAVSPKQALGPCCLLHLSPPGLNQRCISGFVTVTALCLSWNLVLSNPVRLALDGGLSLRVLVRSRRLLSREQHCKGGRTVTSPVIVSLGDELWNTPESSVFVYFRCDQRPQL